MSNDYGESDVTPTESRTTCTVGNVSRGSRETPAISVSFKETDRSEKARCHNADMHVSGESDGSIVPEKQTNKAGGESRGHTTFAFHLPHGGSKAHNKSGQDANF